LATQGPLGSPFEIETYVFIHAFDMTPSHGWGGGMADGYRQAYNPGGSQRQPPARAYLPGAMDGSGVPSEHLSVGRQVTHLPRSSQQDLAARESLIPRYPGLG
jgi:hypothetical protein